jgi:F-BAR domain only protein
VVSATIDDDSTDPIIESRLKSRFGTMLGRRRQSIHGGFAQVPSPSKAFGGFGRNLSSREGRPQPSPRASSSNLQESPPRDNRLSALVESPTSPTSANVTNGTNTQAGLISDVLPATPTTHHTNGTNPFGVVGLSNVQPPGGPPPSHTKPNSETRKDSEGFSVPPAMNDPISQAQQDAAQDSDQNKFKLDIQKDPIQEQDADAQAALSNVANTLRYSQAATPTRKLGTLRGRRDVRNTIYAPQSLDVPVFDNPLPPSPGSMPARASTLPAFSPGEHHAALSTSDTTSIRSGYSLTNNVLVKHADMYQPGLNASIIETVSTTFENGAAQTSKINGEVALIYNKSGLDQILPGKLMISI